MKLSRGLGFLILALSLTALNCNGKQSNEAAVEEESLGVEWFEDATKQSGIDFVHDCGPLDGKYFMPQIVGSGAALFDCDGDGRLDVYLLNNGGPKRLPISCIDNRRTAPSSMPVRVRNWTLPVTAWGWRSAMSTTMAVSMCWSRCTAAFACCSTMARACSAMRRVSRV